MGLKILILLTGLLCIAQNAFAITFQDAMTHSNAFMESVTNFLGQMHADPGLSGFVRSCWLYFSGIAMCFALVKWARNAAELDNLLYQTIMVLIVGTMILHYSLIMDVAWWTHDGITEGLQRVAVGNGDPFFLTAFISDTIRGIFQDGISLWVIWKMSMISMLVLALVAVLAVLALAVNIWVLWCFAIAQILGFFIMPLLLSKRFHFVFDGWMRFLFGVIIYGIVARINLILVSILIRTMFGLPSYSAPVHAIPLDGNTLGQLLGLLCFLGISVFALFKTGSIARSIVSGATGFGGAITSAARLAVGKIM